MVGIPADSVLSCTEVMPYSATASSTCSSVSRVNVRVKIPMSIAIVHHII